MSIITTKETLYIEDMNITSRKSDGYINATQLCQAGKRVFNTYFRRKKTKEFLEVLSSTTQICVVELIKHQKGGNNERHVWVHPQLAINIAQWVSPKFDLLVSRWVYELMLFGNVTLNEERSNKELEEKLKENNTLIKELNEKLLNINIEYKKLRKTHRSILKHKSVHYFKKGKCFYILSNTQEINNDTRVKIGITTDINTRLKNHRTAMPYLKVHYIVFLNKHMLLENIMKEHFESNLNPNNHEFISGISIHNIIEKVRECIQFIKSPHTEETDEELQKYNVDTNTHEVNDMIIEEEINKPVDSDHKIKKPDIKPDIKPEFIKRCAGSFHKTEDDRMMLSSNFHKNRATKDGIAVYCKECTTKKRYKDKNHLERKKLVYDKSLFKYCPGKTHALAEDKIISLDNFHNNKAALDGKSPYCKECIGVLKYGNKRKRRTICYKSAPDGIDTDIHKWCSFCENILDRDKFHSNNMSKDGLQNCCKKCSAIKRTNTKKN